MEELCGLGVLFSINIIEMKKLNVLKQLGFPEGCLSEKRPIPFLMIGYMKLH